MNRSVSVREAPTSSGVLLVGAVIMFTGLLLTGLVAVEGGRHDDDIVWLVILGWLVNAVGAAILLVGLIAKGVALGMKESRDQR